MTATSLKTRIEMHQGLSDYKLMGKLPIIIVVNGKSSNKATSLLDKPFCAQFANCMSQTMHKLCIECEGCVFGYTFNDEIILVLKNDQTPDTQPWFDNKIQKIVSVVSSIATLTFNAHAKEIGLNLISDLLFTAQVFVVPNIVEATNTLIAKQQQSFHTSIQFACFFELLNKEYDKHTIKDMLSGLSQDEKVNLLLQECNVNFNNYPAAFKRGSACYRAPKIINDVVKNKWSINNNIPIFTKDHLFLSQIFRSGVDIFRNDPEKK